MNTKGIITKEVWEKLRIDGGEFGEIIGNIILNLECPKCRDNSLYQHSSGHKTINRLSYILSFKIAYCDRCRYYEGKEEVLVDLMLIEDGCEKRLLRG